MCMVMLSLPILQIHITYRLSIKTTPAFTYTSRTYTKRRENNLSARVQTYRKLIFFWTFSAAAFFFNAKLLRIYIRTSMHVNVTRKDSVGQTDVRGSASG